MYGFTTTLTGTTFDQTVTRTITALKAEGFGVLSDIDVQHALIAHGHTLHALHHSNEAIMVRTEKPAPAKKA